MINLDLTLHLRVEPRMQSSQLPGKRQSHLHCMPGGAVREHMVPLNLAVLCVTCVIFRWQHWCQLTMRVSQHCCQLTMRVPQHCQLTMRVPQHFCQLAMRVPQHCCFQLTMRVTQHCCCQLTMRVPQHCCCQLTMRVPRTSYQPLLFHSPLPPRLAFIKEHVPLQISALSSVS